MKAFVGIILLIQAVHFTDGACTFPSAFQNTWVTNTRGTWTVNSSSISNFPAQVQVSGQELFTMDCEVMHSGFYVLKSQESRTLFGGSDYNVVACLYLQEQSPYSFLYSLLTAEFSVTSTVTERVTVLAVTASSLNASLICSDTAYDTAGERVHVALLNGSESLGKTDCPSLLQGHFTYVGTTCNSTSVDVCTDTGQISYNTTACTQNTIYSQNGTLDCVYHNTIGSYTYVTVYNEDTSVDNSNYYAFSCLVVSEAGVYTYASVKPTECEANQVPTSTPTGGYTTVFEETAACTTSTTSSEDLTYLYVIIGIIVLLLIIAFIILIICCCKCRKKRKDVESADDSESEKGSEDAEDDKRKDGDGKTDMDETKQEVVDEQQPTKSDEDKQSVDSGFIPGKEETKQKKRRRRRRRRRRKRRKDKGEAGEEEEEEEEDGEEEDESSSDKSDEDGSGSDDEGDKMDDDVTLKDGRKLDKKDDDEEENANNKKDRGKHIVPLSKVLVTREMEEKNREKASRRKSKTRGVRLFASKKSKKHGVSDENPDDEMNDPDMEEIHRDRFPHPVAPFMEQYHSKKDIEKKLEDAHYWDLPEDDNIVMQLDQIVRDFEEELAKEEQKEIERMDVDNDVTVVGNKTINEGETKTTNDAGEEVTNKQEREDIIGSRSSSRADSPESKKVRKDDSTSDLESAVFDLDDDCLPEGYTRNENGHIVRMADGKVYTRGTFQRHMKKARLKRLFNIPRLNRNKKGRPTGGMKDDTYGPENQNNDTEEPVGDTKKEGDEERTSVSAQRSSDERKRTSESRRRSKTVVFSDALGHFDKDGNFIEKEEQPRIDSAAVNRRKLRNRLFRKKKRKTGDLPPLMNGVGGNGQVINVLGADDDRPRELSNLVKVYGQPGTINSTAPRSTLPPIGLTRSSTSTFDQNQLQNFRDGLSKDQEILGRSNTIGKIPLAAGVRRVSVDELSSGGASNDNDEDAHNVELGSEDEFFLVGGQSQNEPLFTRVRPPPESELAQALKSNHDRRHAIPWSIINPPPRRPHTDGGGLTQSLDAPRSADMASRGMDDKRLRELLEELYKDKKYFDHVIDTSAPQENPDIDDRFLAEHGRDFLLDRADFWEDRGPLPPRPPRTSLGMRLSRVQTMTDSGRVSMTSTDTCTPTVTELPNQIPIRQENTFS
ncbi:uncharacterized protein [Argopecten irradians]|uniref:uncharacterized protein n=1 Tax=Argopecten irradians TaxID=31199 RepID=UPI003723FF74